MRREWATSPGALSNRIFKYSVIIPDGPTCSTSPRNPQILKQEINVQVERTVGSTSATNGFSDTRRSSLLILPRLLKSVPGAKESPSRAWRAFDNSPMCTRPNARAALAWMVSFLPRRLLHLAVVPVTEASKEVSNKVNQSPALNMDTLSCNPCLGHQSPSWRSEKQQPGKQEEELPTTNLLHAVTPGSTLQNLLQTHLQTSPEHALHEVGDGLHDLCSHFGKPHPNSPRPILRNRSTSLSSVA